MVRRHNSRRGRSASHAMGRKQVVTHLYPWGPKDMPSHHSDGHCLCGCTPQSGARVQALFAQLAQGTGRSCGDGDTWVMPT